MINWDVVLIVAYVALIVGGPLCFYIFSEVKKDADMERALLAFNDEVDGVVADKIGIEIGTFKNDIKKKDEELKQKDAALAALNLELSKIRPLLKYVRQTPSDTGGNPPTGQTDFGDDVL